MLIVSKIDVLLKNEVLIGNVPTRILTIEELTRTKIGVVKAIVDKIVEKDGKLIEQDAVEVDTIVELAVVHTAEVDCSGVDEEGCSSVDGVIDTSIEDT